MQRQERTWRGWWKALHEENAELLEQVPAERVRGLIVLASALGLYFELLIIRWHATSSHVFSIFKNVSLLSCFLGLGVGFAMSSRVRKISLGTFLPILAIQTVVFGLLASTIGGRRVNPVAEQLVMGLQSRDWSWLHVIEGNGFLAGIFLLNAAMFLPWGYLTGRLMQRLPALESYGWNLIGSLAGIVAFFLVSLTWMPPAVWFGVGLLAAVPLLLGNQRMMTAAMASLAAILLTSGLMGRVDERRYYSPYQLITYRLPRLDVDPPSHIIKVNSAFFQSIFDLTSDRQQRNEFIAGQAAYYNLPYKLLNDPGHVLVVGAGSGNDVAAALRNGASKVTAVEIDPAIVYLGKHLHPERPYKDPRTDVVVTDARTFIRQTEGRFDAIVYGLLDSHTNMGAMTNVRLDSFVYTLEAFQEAAKRLTDRGVILCSYCLMDQSQGDKLYALLKQVDPKGEPRVFASVNGQTFVAGPGTSRLAATLPEGVQDLTADYAGRVSQTDLPTDDWPYFYMQKRAYPATYAVMIVMLLALSAWVVKRQLGSLGDWNPQSGVFFFLGMGFMLVETKVITELGLVYGNTWLVSAIAIVGVLLMGYAGNLLIARRGRFPEIATFPLLGLFLLAGLWSDSLTGFAGPAAQKLLLPAMLCAPMFFAGLIFSGKLSQSGSAAAAISANLFGAMFGGFLEYNSMYWGLRSLYPVALTVYGLAAVCYYFDRTRSQQSVTGATDSTAPDLPVSRAA